MTECSAWNPRSRPAHYTRVLRQGRYAQHEHWPTSSSVRTAEHGSGEVLAHRGCSTRVFGQLLRRMRPERSKLLLRQSSPHCKGNVFGLARPASGSAESLAQPMQAPPATSVPRLQHPPTSYSLVRSFASVLSKGKLAHGLGHTAGSSKFDLVARGKQVDATRQALTSIN